ncbi:helix-turn-helix domain-containing protein [Lysinibacillus xylanilyticus]|uniref:helix-turn-helix domain-containing protein n=1 Tax=Lysinibacillus xylanilyticus TaxID=582475 RepID=UPI003D01E92B
MSVVYITSFDFHILSKLNLGGRLKFFRQHLMQYEENMDLYTIKAIAERLKLTPQAISAVERGLSKNPSFGLIHKLVKEYNVSMDTLTDEYYQGEEKLFSIGKHDESDVEDLEFEDWEVIHDTEPKKINSGFWDPEKNDYALPTPSIGVLLYRYNENKHFDVLYKNAINKNFSEIELQKLLIRLDLDIALFSSSDLSVKHITDLMNDYQNKNAKSIPVSLDAKEMLKLLTKNK